MKSVEVNKLLVVKDEDSNAEQKDRSKGEVEQEEHAHIVTLKKLSLPIRKGKFYPGSNQGNSIGFVE